MPTPATNKRGREQAPFSHRVKLRLLERGQSVTDVARELGLNRNTVSRAIHHELFSPTRQKIAHLLDLDL